MGWTDLKRFEIGWIDKLSLVKIVKVGWSRLKCAEVGWGWYFKIDQRKEHGLNGQIKKF